MANSTTARLKRSDLLGLVESQDEWPQGLPPSKTLILDGTKIDDEALNVLERCQSLRSLHLANAIVTRPVIACFI